MDKVILKAEQRKLSGRKTKALRRSGIIPGNVYGKKVKSVSLQVDLSEFKKVFAKTGETNLVELQLGKEVKPVLIHNIQIDPVSDALLHIDFLQVDLKEKVTAQIPLELVGESPAEKQGLGTVVLYLNELEVEALPADLPDKFEIDATALTEVDQAVAVKDLKVDVTKVEVKAEPDEILAKVEPPRAEEEILPPATEVEEGAAEATIEATAEADNVESQEEAAE